MEMEILVIRSLKFFHEDSFATEKELLQNNFC